MHGVLPLMGIVFDIQRFALHDGPGIRTTVFLKGCPLRCIWCHNPESQRFAPQLSFNVESCRLCGDCVPACSQGVHEIIDGRHIVHFDACLTCGACVEACDERALTIVGREMSVDQVLAEVERDRPYYERSGGGLTLSGGEPLAQFDFALALLQEARNRGIHTCLDTSGIVSRSRLATVADHVDLFLFDYKATSPETHRQLTGASNRRVLDNLLFLYERGARIILRCLLVPGVNDSEEHLEAIVALDAQLPALEGIHVLPFHTMGRDKGPRIGRVNPLADLPAPGSDVQNQWIATLHDMGCTRAHLG